MYTMLDAAFSMYYDEPLRAEFASPLGGKKSRKGIRLGKAVKYGALAGGGLGLLRGGIIGGTASAAAAKGMGFNPVAGGAAGAVGGGVLSGTSNALKAAGTVALGYGAYRGAKALGRKIRRSKKRKYR